MPRGGEHKPNPAVSLRREGGRGMLCIAEGVGHKVCNRKAPNTIL